MRNKMKIKLLKLISIVFLAGGFLIYSGLATSYYNKPIKSAIDFITGFFAKDVVMAIGIDFWTGKSIILNPIAETTITTCNPDSLGDLPTNQAQVTQIGCNSQVINPTPELANALQSSQGIINGTIRKNGQDIPARFVVAVTALYEGSLCQTYFSGGDQWELCTTLEDNCKQVLPLAVYGQKNETVRRNVRNSCMQFVNTWKKPDCKQLHPVYRRDSTGYTRGYRQFVWDTCRAVPQTPPLAWGSRP
jgi:hypothetical protein